MRKLIMLKNIHVFKMALAYQTSEEHVNRRILLVWENMKIVNAQIEPKGTIIENSAYTILNVNPKHFIISV